MKIPMSVGQEELKSNETAINKQVNKRKQSFWYCLIIFPLSNSCRVIQVIHVLFFSLPTKLPDEIITTRPE